MKLHCSSRQDRRSEKKFTVALVLSRLDYCKSVLFGLHANLIQRLQSVQNAAARLIFRIRRSEHITLALISLYWLRIPERYLLQTGSYDVSIRPRHFSVQPTVVFHPCFRGVWTFRTIDYSYHRPFVPLIICCYCQLLRRYEVQMLLMKLSIELHCKRIVKVFSEYRPKPTALFSTQLCTICV